MNSGSVAALCDRPAERRRDRPPKRTLRQHRARDRNADAGPHQESDRAAEDDVADRCHHERMPCGCAARGAPAMRSTASIIAFGSATPLPAMSWALPCATEENRIGVPMAKRRGGVFRQQLGGDVALIVQHHHERVEARHVKHRVGAERPGDRETVGRRRIDRRLDDVDLLAAEQPAFTGMRVEAAHGDLRRGDAHALQRADGFVDDARHALARDRIERLPHALVQGRVRDFRVAEAQHHEDVVLGRSGLACHERGMAVERNAGHRDRGFVLRGRDHRGNLPGQRRFHRGAAERNRRAPGRGAGRPERDGLRLRAIEHRQPGAGRTGILDPADRMQFGLDAASEGVPLEDGCVADQDRTAGRPHRRVERGLQADFRPNARGVAGRDCNHRFVGCHGVF